MEQFYEPIFLNEKMMLNTAVYLFKGVTLESEVTEDNGSEKKGKGSLGFKFLQDLISPVSIEGELNSKNNVSTKFARIYTLGGLYMTVVEELKEKKQLKAVTLSPLNVPENTFVSLDVVLKPVDFYQIIEVIKLSKPLIIQVMQDFGIKWFANTFTKNSIKEIPKYDKLLESIISSLEEDYLKSKQLEMLMISPETGETIGIVDIDLTDIEAQEIKAKLNDGQFHVVGKVSRYFEKGQNMSMVQRTVLSKIVELLGQAMSIDSDPENFNVYKKSLVSLQPVIEKFVQINLPGPAVRVIAMSVSV